MEGYLGGGWLIGLEDSIFLPLLLIFLLDRNEAISFLGLPARSVRIAPSVNRGVLTPFNSLVLEIVAVSKAFAAASTAAMIAVVLKNEFWFASEFCTRCLLTH